MKRRSDEYVKGLAVTLAGFADGCALAAVEARERTEFEATREARAAFLLLRQHSIVIRDLVTSRGAVSYPSCWPIARSMLEIGVRSAWRMDQDDPLAAEARWVVWLRKRARHEWKEAASLAREGLTEAAADATDRAQSFRRFGDAVEEALTDHGVAVPPGDKEPSMALVMRDLGLEDNYQLYAEASERQHGNLVGLEAYTRNLGEDREYGEFARWQDLVPPLRAALGGVIVLSQIFGRRTATPEFADLERAAWADWEVNVRRLRLAF